MKPASLIAFRSAMLLCVSCAAVAQDITVSAADYLPRDPAEYCIRTRTYTYGRSGSDKTRIVGTLTVAYKSGPVTGFVVENGFEPGGGVSAYANDGSTVILPLAVRDIDGAWIYASRDCQLSGAPTGVKLIPDIVGNMSGLVWGVKGSTCVQLEDPDEPGLLKGPKSVVSCGFTYEDAFLYWDLQSERPYVPLDFKGRDRVLGIQLPTRADTANHAVSGFTVIAKGHGPVAGGRVDSLTGVLSSVWEVTAIDCTSPNPGVFDGGVVNAASFERGQAVAPGSLVSIYGFDLAKNLASATSIPLPLQLDDVSVTFNGIPAPLLVVVPRGSTPTTQINAQVPWDILPPGRGTGTAALVVRRGGVASLPSDVEVTRVSPGVFAYPPGAGQAIAVLRTQDERNGAVAAPRDAIPGVRSAPARAGDGLEIYATGLGTVDIPIPSGHSSLDVIRRTASPAVRIGGASAEVLYSGLSPWFVGVNQVNVTVPLNARQGAAVPLRIQMGGSTSSERVTIAVE